MTTKLPERLTILRRDAAGNGHFEINPAYAEALEQQNRALVEALNEIASWNEGDKVDGSFDEPASARRARESLAAHGGAT